MESLCLDERGRLRHVADRFPDKEIDHQPARLLGAEAGGQTQNGKLLRGCVMEACVHVLWS